ncbi:hypothetical protein GCM10010532_001720 [Dactylosporangium siamense]|uniref:Lipoprotein n=1 Tax=Dactylosporangium siamense TaxID=685454 RepID=A0A919U7A2_9ACTN|nr:hypothetical protein Dsi01nite_023930 [Dactylosporangium siamense]
MRVSSRRAVLAGAAAALTTLTACDIPKRSAATWHPAPDVLLPLLTRTVALRDRYAEILTAFPALQDRLGPLKDNHAAHVVALAREVGLDENGPMPAASASAGPVVQDQAAVVKELAGLEKAGQEDATGACLAAPSYRAALLGSIAACRAAHVEVLT